MFMVKYSFMSIVQNFHLPCVRTYYDGDNVYMTPSCITAHLTYMNLDYKYFAGTKNPVEIINKYRMRGFGTWLNENEKIVLLKYSGKNQKWNNLYSIDFGNNETLISNLGALKISHKLFRPRLFNPDDFIDAPPVDIQQGYFNFSSIKDHTGFESPDDYVVELSERYNNKDNLQYILILKKLQTINENGSINPVEKWIIEFVWNVFQFDKPVVGILKRSPLKYKKIEI